jgi:class 3 adenylate cyclase
MSDGEPPSIDKPFDDYFQDQAQLSTLLDTLVEKLRQGKSLELREQVFLSRFAKSVHARAVGSEFRSRISRMTRLASHFHNEVTLAALSNPAIADRLEAAIATGRRETGWVLSADIRNSTELMLRAKDASHFATFLSALSARMNSGLTNPCGYFDKFTGDGWLAFFADGLCGSLAELYALNASAFCQGEFSKVLNDYSPALFGAERPRTGLGIGLAYGEVQFVEIAKQKTIVGEAVVWACRLSGCPAGRTYLTKESMMRVREKYPQLGAKFRAVQQVVKPKGRRVVGWWRGDLSDFPELELVAPEWYLELNPDLMPLPKTRSSYSE